MRDSPLDVCIAEAHGPPERLRFHFPSPNPRLRFRALMPNGERVLVARHSAFNQIVLTEDEEGLRILRFGDEGVCQSIVKVDDPEHLALPYATVLPLCLAFLSQLGRMLIVGLGGGTLPRFFHHHFPELAIDVVEIDEAVLEVARDYCGFQEDALLRVHIDDGRHFVESSASRYDLIVLDSFDAESIPAHMRTAEFLQSVRAALTPDGMAVGNVWGRGVNRLYEDMLATYRHAFDDVYIFDVPAAGTKLFVALPRRQEMTRDHVLAYGRQLSERLGFRSPIANALAGFRRAEHERVRGGVVLHD